MSIRGRKLSDSWFCFCLGWRHAFKLGWCMGLFLQERKSRSPFTLSWNGTVFFDRTKASWPKWCVRLMNIWSYFLCKIQSFVIMFTKVRSDFLITLITCLNFVEDSIIFHIYILRCNPNKTHCSSHNKIFYCFPDHKTQYYINIYRED